MARVNRRGRRGGDGVRVVACPLPSWPDRATVHVSRPGLELRATFCDAAEAGDYLAGPAAVAARVYLAHLDRVRANRTARTRRAGIRRNR